MRHGDRIDNFDLLWVPNTERPWDPILIEVGKARARATGAHLSGLDFPIHRVFVSPFIRCRRTAAEALLAFSSAKVAIEYGLYEMPNNQVIKPSVIPKDGNWFPEKSELESIFPEGTIDHSVIPIYEEIKVDFLVKI
ncbi:hypothetical protein LUZ60_007516 [Juncus effusus]|nr:hypothetical protein LUZ60_007516 [Juncus effusus]